MPFDALEGLAQWSTGEACLAPVPSSTLHVHACHPRGALPVYWACRMFNRPGEQSWCAQADPDTPGYQNNNNNKNNKNIYMPFDAPTSILSFFSWFME
jgi:hypothetical protein